MELTFKKSELIAQIKQQRNAHNGIFKKALKRYRKMVLAELDGFIERVKKGERIRIMSALPVPEEHTAEFDRVLKMLESCVEEEITLSEDEYRMYVLGEWGWQMSFAANTVSYTT